MVLRLMVDGLNDRAAIMTNTPPANPWTDPAFTNPIANLNKFKWHSGLYYLGISRVLTGTFDLNANSSGWAQTADGYVKTLRAHGSNFAPILMGYFTIDGVNVPITGDVLVSSQANGAGVMQVLNASANTSSIVLLQNQVNGLTQSAARVIAYTIYVCNIGVNAAGAAVFPTRFSGFEATRTRLRSGYYDTNLGYFNRDAEGPIYLFRGKSTNYQIGRPVYTDSSYAVLGLDFRVGSYARSAGTYPATNTLGVGPATWPGTTSAANAPLFTPSTVRISASMPSSAVATLDAGAGRIRMGNTLDTNKNTMLISNFLSVSKTIPALSVGGSRATNSEIEIDVGAVSAFATDVIGTATINGETFSIGGTRRLTSRSLRMTNSSGYYQESSSTGANFFAAARYLYFAISGGRLVMRVGTRWPRLADGAITLPALTVNIKAFAATFDF